MHGGICNYNPKIQNQYFTDKTLLQKYNNDEYTERKQIQKYLEDKRLPLDIYMEIEDHIISQIEDLEKKGFGFQEAFTDKTKWKKELSFQNFNFSDVKAVPKIVAKIRNAYIREIMPKILAIFLYY